MNLSTIEMNLLFVKHRSLSENYICEAILDKVSTYHLNGFNPAFPNPNEPLMTDSCYKYTFLDMDPDETIYGSPNLYILLLIRFTHKDGSISPMPRNGEKTYLIYRYKVDVPKAPYNERRLFHKAETQFEKVLISPYNMKVYNF